MLPRAGQIWKLVPPEKNSDVERFVRITDVREVVPGTHSVSVLNVRKQDKTGWVPLGLEHFHISANRFQGQPGGFVLHKKEK